MLLRLAWQSLLNRRVSVLLTLMSLTLSVVIVIGVEHVRSQARDSFSRTVSGVDLIVGARTSQINLLLYSVFRIGNASNNISWDSYREIAQAPNVAWSIPLALGDSHRGYRVLGTNEDYFRYFRHGAQTPLSFREGLPFSAVFEAVLGFEAANKLQYRLGDEITLAHGLGAVSFSNHDDAPFKVVGILAPTGTPVDQTVHVSLQGLEAIHLGWQNGIRMPGIAPDYANPGLAELQPAALTAFMLGLDSRLAVFSLQRAINEYRAEALSAILPGVALAELWQTAAIAEKVLGLISLLVMLATLLGMATMLLSSMKERQREIALYRAMGAHSSTILLLIELESLLITVTGIACGFVVVHLLLLAGQQWLVEHYGLLIDTLPLNARTGWFMLLIISVALLLAVIPAVAAYRSSLATRLRFNS